MTGGPSYVMAVYSWMREAPAFIFSYASFPLDTPPTPIIGISPKEYSDSSLL